MRYTLANTSCRCKNAPLRYNRTVKCCKGPTMFSQLDRRASLTPDATALLAPGRSPLTYRQLWDHVQRSQNALTSLGIRPREVTALVVPNSPELITAFLAVAGTGACAPLDPALTEREFHFCLSRLRARTLIVPDDLPEPAARAARSLGMQVATIHIPPDQPAGVFELRDTGGSALAPGRETDAALLLFTRRSALNDEV